MDRPPVELPHPVRMRILGAVMIGVFLAALDQTVVGTALPANHHRSRRQRPLHVGLHGLPAHLDHQRSALRQAPTCSAAGRSSSSGSAYSWPVRFWPGLSQEMWQLVAARGVQGLGAGRALPDRARGHRRHLHALGARSLPGSLRRRLRVVRARRPRDRRADHRHHRLAVRVLLQSSGRCCGLRQACGATCRSTTPPATGRSRLPRRGTIQRGAGPDPGRL